MAPARPTDYHWDMKAVLRKLVGPILRPFESGNDPYAYKPSHRRILVFMSTMFLALASLIVFLTPTGNFSYLLPVLLFGGGGLLGLIIGTLGSDRAVAKIWGTR